MRRVASWRPLIKSHAFGRCRKHRCKRLRAAGVLVRKLLSSRSLQYFVSRVCVDAKQEGGRFFILGFSMLSFQIFQST